MSSGLDDILAEPAVESEAPAPAPETAAPAESSAPPPPSQAHTAPLHALLDERDKRKAAEAEAAELRAWRAEQERKQYERREAAPDPLDDPHGFVAWQQEQLLELQKQFEQQRFEDRIAISRDQIEQQLDPKQAEDLFAWIDSWPREMHARAGREANPYRWAWQQFSALQRQRRGAELSERLNGRDLDEYIEELVSQRLAAAPAPSKQPQRSSAPSLAAVNGAPAPRGAEAGASSLDSLLSRG